MTAVAVEYRPAMDSCMVGMRLYRTCALTALRVPDPSDPGEYPEVYGWLAQGYFKRYAWTESIASANVSMKELLYNFGVANVFGVMKMVTATWPQLMLASVTMCNDDISNYNSKISDLGYLTPQSKGWCLCRARGSVIWFWALLHHPELLK